MFPVDQLHQLIRHTCSDHRRETISFVRRIESILGRAHLVAVWKNFIKSRSERKPDRTTPVSDLRMPRKSCTENGGRTISRSSSASKSPEVLQGDPAIPKTLRPPWAKGDCEGFGA